MYGYLVRKQEQKLWRPPRVRFVATKEVCKVQTKVSAAEVVKMLFLLNQGLHPGILATIIPL
jgi:hypothetical protein